MRVGTATFVRCLLSSALISVGGWAVFPATVSADIQADIVAVGFPFQQGWGYRLGCWVPVVVDVSLVNQPSFDGRLRVQQRDRDGDVCYDEVEVHLVQSSDSAATPRRYTLYSLIGPQTATAPAMTVQVLEGTEEEGEGRVAEVISQGQRVRALPVPATLVELSDDDVLVLSVGEGTIGRIAELESRGQGDRFERAVHVGHVAARSLPERWQGLEMIDCVVWEEADPTRLTEPQTRALVEWVRQGGTLILAAGRTAPALADAPRWSDLLPVEVDAVETVADLPRFLREFLTSSDYLKPRYVNTMTVARCRVRSGGKVIHGEHSISPSLDTDLITQRRVNRGVVIFIGAALSELLACDGDVVKFYQGLVGLRPPISEDAGGFAWEPVFDQVVAETGFTGIGGLFLVLALLFTGSYIVFSTFGTWFFLRKRHWEKHNWSAFALAAAVGTVVSLLAVQSTRGLGRKVEQLTIVDGEAGDRFARAACYFGLKTSTDSTLEVWLPEDYARLSEPEESACYLKPLPIGTELSAYEGSYTDPVRYRLLPSRSAVRDARVRATVKQFEGRWVGELEGTIRADVSVVLRKPPEPSETLDGSMEEITAAAEPKKVSEVFQLRGTITNTLPYALKNCKVIHARDSLYRENNYLGKSRNENIYVHRLGRLEPGATVDLATLYQKRDSATGIIVDESISEWSKRTLKAEWDKQGRFFGRWLDSGKADLESGGWGDTLLMLSTTSDGVTVNSVGGFGGKTRLSRSRLRHLDIGDRLDDETALLVGEVEEDADHPGPVQLCTRSGFGGYKPVQLSKGRTMYRFLIPLKRSEDRSP